MSTHDVLSYALAAEAVKRIRAGDSAWSGVLSANVHPTASRVWPVPDFVIVDEERDLTVAAEFKPPNQSKREYLTGLGQVIAYTRDFNYGLLVIPEISDDGYAIATHVESILSQDVLTGVPVGLLRYDPRMLSAANPLFDVIRALEVRINGPSQKAAVAESFYAKWREISPTEIGRYLEHLYDEGRREGATGTVRDRAFASLWAEIQAGRMRHWGGGVRHATNSVANRTGWLKNYRNFLSHIGWTQPDGKLTDDGLGALHLVHQYGAESRIFSDLLASTLLEAGKHLVLINAINEFQDQAGSFANETEWLDAVEEALENEGLLKRNVGRAAAAVASSARQFLKAEKQLWKNLSLIVPYGPTGGRVYHPGRGFIFNWARITALIT